MRRSDPFDGLIGDRRSVPINYTDPEIRNRLARANPVDEFYGHMFAEDLSRLFPYGRGIDAGFDAHISADANDVEAMLLDALPVQYRPPQFLVDGLRDFASDCARELVNGPILLEVELFRSADGARARAFDIRLLPHGLFGCRRGKPIQWIERRDLGGERQAPFVTLDRHRVVMVDLPKPLRAELNASNTLIREVGATQGVATDMIVDSKTAAFDFSAHQRLIGEAALRRTRAIGWDGRGLFLDEALEPYKIWRRLRFARFQLHVRDAIIEGLDRVLQVVGAELGFAAVIELERVLTIGDLDRAEASLEVGDRPVSALMRLEPDDPMHAEE